MVVLDSRLRCRWSLGPHPDPRDTHGVRAVVGIWSPAREVEGKEVGISLSLGGCSDPWGCTVFCYCGDLGMGSFDDKEDVWTPT